MNAKRQAVWAISMAASLSTLAGCGSAPSIAMAPKAAPEPIADGRAYQPSPAQEADAPMPPPPPADAPLAPSSRKADKAWDDAPRGERRHEQPGLGTEWGETRVSSISTVPFERADARSPFASLSLYYNDREGANATASVIPRWTSSFDIASGLVTVGLRDERGHNLHGFLSGNRDYVVGEAGLRYSIVLHNNTDHRLEVVLSVDGLDVMDGKTASFDKRGYILDARGDLEVDGFRQSMETVAAFRFGSVRGSYAAQKHGDTRNVGVIGVALFHERGAPEPVWSSEEIRRRRNANPFPGEFATPPGG